MMICSIGPGVCLSALAFDFWPKRRSSGPPLGRLSDASDPAQFDRPLAKVMIADVRVLFDNIYARVAPPGLIFRSSSANPLYEIPYQRVGSGLANVDDPGKWIGCDVDIAWRHRGLLYMASRRSFFAADGDHIAGSPCLAFSPDSLSL